MNNEYFLIFLVLITGLIFLVRVTEASKRRMILFFMLPVIFLIRYLAIQRNVETEALTSLWVAIFLNIILWFLWRPKRNDEIKVMGLDD
jgi:nicotinamide riboside transporter PnuC